jgi:uncharacterized protein
MAIAMKQIVRRAAGCGLLALALTPALAPLAVAAAPHPTAPTVLHLSQTAERRLPRDMLRVDMRAEQTADNPQTVEAAINALMAKALVEVHGATGVDVETGSYAVYRINPPKGRPQWTGTQSLMLSGRDFAMLLKLAGRLQAQGLVMSNLAYEASRQTTRRAEDALTSDALSSLQQRAAAIARQLGLSVAGYRDLTVGNAQSGEPPRPLFGMAAARAAMPAPVGAPGEARVSVTVSAEILLAPQGR